MFFLFPYFFVNMMFLFCFQIIVMSFLKEDPDWVITFRGEGYHLGVRNSDETSMGNPLEFNGLHRVGGGPGYMVYPF